MPTREEWAEAAMAARAGGDGVRALYQCAIADGRQFLRGYDVSPDDAETVAADCFHSKWQALAEAEEPRTAFRAWIRNLARDRIRRRQVRRADEIPESSDKRALRAHGGDEDRVVAALDAARKLTALRAALATLRKPEHQDILIAVLVEERSRDDVAAEFGTTRNNVDVIVKRFRARIAELER